MKKILLIFFIHISALAQDDFPFVTVSDLQQKVYPKDSSANAVILSDYGEARIQKDDSRGYVVVYYRKKRIKILNKEGYQYASIQIPRYHLNFNETESITEIVGTTYTLENGEIMASELKKDGIFEEKTVNNYYTQKIQMPNIKEGCIIEYSYQITSDFIFQIRDWDFQRDIPTQRSHYKFYLIPGFQYRTIIHGYNTLAMNKEQNVGDGVMYEYMMNEMPALREELYITSLEDYRSKITHELVAVRLPSIQRNFAKQWQDVDITLLSEPRFGGAIRNAKFIKEEVNKIKAEFGNDTLKLINNALKLVQTNIEWNGQYGIYANPSTKEAYQLKKGNIASMNLLLVAILKDLDLESNAIILSTRNNGKVPKDFPQEGYFNYVVAQTTYQGKNLFLDASDKLLKVGMLPFQCLNGEARLINVKAGKWLSFNSKYNFLSFVNLKASIDENNMTGVYAVELNGYEAIGQRRRILKEGIEKYKEKLNAEQVNMKCSNIIIENADNPEELLKIKYDFTLESEHSSPQLIYTPTVLLPIFKENPFKQPERNFPVDFGATQDYFYQSTLKIPANFTVEHFPSPISLILENNGGKFSFYCQFNTETSEIVVSSRIVVARSTFSAKEYQGIRNFFSRIIEKQSDMIVLKRK
jgi:hypothetical protein